MKKQIIPKKWGCFRRGSTLVEAAIVLPVFLLMMMTLWEFCHFYFVGHMLDDAARRAARTGVTEGTSSLSVTDKAKNALAGSFDVSKVSVSIKNGESYDTPGIDAGSIVFDDLPGLELNDASSRQLFIVRVEVPYDDVAILSGVLFGDWLRGKKIVGQSVMRRE